MASPAPVRPFSQPQLLGPFLQHFVRQFRRTLRRPCRVARRCGSGGSAGSALSFYSSVLWRWARAGMSPRCRAAKWSHGEWSALTGSERALSGLGGCGDRPLLRPPVAPADTHHHYLQANVCASWKVGLLHHYHHHRTPPLLTVEMLYGNLSGSLCKHRFLIQQKIFPPVFF